jgi:hypothetical protein
MPAIRPAKRSNKRGENPPNIALSMVRYVAIIAVPPARMLDVVGPAEVFAGANKLHGGQPVYETDSGERGRHDLERRHLKLDESI